MPSATVASSACTLIAHAGQAAATPRSSARARSHTAMITATAAKIGPCEPSRQTRSHALSDGNWITNGSESSAARPATAATVCAVRENMRCGKWWAV